MRIFVLLISLKAKPMSTKSPTVKSVLRLLRTESMSSLIFAGFVKIPRESALSLMALRSNCWRDDRSKSLVEWRERANFNAVFPSNV